MDSGTIAFPISATDHAELVRVLEALRGGVASELCHALTTGSVGGEVRIDRRHAEQLQKLLFGRASAASLSPARADRERAETLDRVAWTIGGALAVTRAAGPRPGRLDGIHALVVDEHPGMVEAYAEILAPLGATVTTAHTPEEALRASARVIPHVVITDVTFGGRPRNGLWLLEKLHTLRRFAQLRVIGVTTGDPSLPASTFDAVLVRPVEPARLAALVAELARRRSTQVRHSTN